MRRREIGADRYGFGSRALRPAGAFTQGKAYLIGGIAVGIRRWVGILGSAGLGILFPYTLVGCILLLNGFMAPSRPSDKLLGIGIAALYILILILINAYALRGLDARARRRALSVNLLVWLAVGLVLLYLQTHHAGGWS